MNHKNRFTRLDSGVIYDAQQNLEIYPESFEVDNHQAAIDKCAALGEGWRMPTVDELAGLVDRTLEQQACDPLLNMPFSDWHLSSSLVFGWPGGAWCVRFGYGGYVDSYGARGSSGFVRPVRKALRALGIEVHP